LNDGVHASQRGGTDAGLNSQLLLNCAADPGDIRLSSFRHRRLGSIPHGWRRQPTPRSVSSSPAGLQSLPFSAKVCHSLPKSAIPCQSLPFSAVLSLRLASIGALRLGGPLFLTQQRGDSEEAALVNLVDGAAATSRTNTLAKRRGGRRPASGPGRGWGRRRRHVGGRNLSQLRRCGRPWRLSMDNDHHKAATKNREKRFIRSQIRR
jgi:hypothetical protein